VAPFSRVQCSAASWGILDNLRRRARCLVSTAVPLVGAVQVYAGLTLVNKVGAGPLVGLTVTACLLASLAIDHFGWFRMDLHPLTLWRALGGLLLIAGVALIAKF
jgi:uncharacterized membrane protein YdcZ (DUF606 family)